MASRVGRRRAAHARREADLVRSTQQVLGQLRVANAMMQLQKNTREPTCQYCGKLQPVVEIEQLGFEGAIAFVEIACQCPRPRCPWCHRALDQDGYCPSLPVVDCWAGGLLIPLPEIA